MRNVYLEASCTLNGAAIAVTVHETGTDGEWTQTVELDDGTGEYLVDTLPGEENHEYHCSVELAVGDAIPELHSLAVTSSTPPPVIKGGMHAPDREGYRAAGSGPDLGDDGAQYSGSSEQSSVTATRRGVGYGEIVGASYSPVSTNRWGGTYGISSKSIGSLLDQDGFVLVLESGGGEKQVFGPERPYQSITSLSIVEEVNTKSDWTAEVPPVDGLHDWQFARAVIGYEGERLFHGVVVGSGSGYGDAVELSGFGPLWHATHGELTLTYPDDHPEYSGQQDIPAWRAIEHAWREVSRKTDGKVRGYPIRPPAEKASIIPAEGQEFSGTPLAVIQRMHTYADMAFAIDHSEPQGVAVSFTPGAEHRAARWQSTDYDTSVDPDGYANRVVVKGARAEADAYPYARYRGVAEAPQQEVQAVADGKIIEETVPKHDLTTETACEEQAQSTLAELRGNYTITGSVECTPTHVTPGYTYRVEEFDAEAPDVFTPVRLPLQSVEHTFGLDEATTTLKFETPEGVERAIRQQVLPEGVSLDVLRQDIDIGPPGEPGEAGGLDRVLDYVLDG